MQQLVVFLRGEPSVDPTEPKSAFVAVTTTFESENYVSDLATNLSVVTILTRETCMKIAARCNVLRAKEGDADFVAFLKSSEEAVAVS